MSKTDPPGRHVMKVREDVTSADCANDPEPTPRGRAAEQMSAIGLSLLAHERPTWVGKQPSAAQLSATFAAFDDRPNQLPGCGDGLAGLVFIGKYTWTNIHIKYFIE